VGLFKKKSPTFGDPATNAIAQMLLSADSDSNLFGRNLLVSDGMLHSYEHMQIDWQSVWRAASERRSGVPPFGVRPYWTPSGPAGSPAPLSILAFCSAAARLRIAKDPTSDANTLAMLAGDAYLTGRPDPRAGDPNPDVQRAAAQRL